MSSRLKQPMEKSRRSYEPQLTIREHSVPVGREWALPTPGWTVIQIRSGSGYYLQRELNRRLEEEAVLLTSSDFSGSLRASQLGALSFCTFSVIPARLTGLLTLVELNRLEAAASRKAELVEIQPPGSPAAQAMRELYRHRHEDGLRHRLQRFQFFVEMLEPELEPAAASAPATDARARLESLFKQTPSAELLALSFAELARTVHCTPRHLARLFREITGVSFRAKRSLLRLERARELLATSEAKIVEVALDSGFKSLSLFNLMFTRQYGLSPGKWRQKQRTQREDADAAVIPPRRRKIRETSVRAARDNPRAL